MYRGAGSTEVHRAAGSNCSATRGTALYLLTFLLETYLSKEHNWKDTEPVSHPSLGIWFTTVPRKQKSRSKLSVSEQCCAAAPAGGRTPLEHSSGLPPDSYLINSLQCFEKRYSSTELWQISKLSVLALLAESGRHYLIWFCHCSWPATYLLLNTLHHVY